MTEAAAGSSAGDRFALYDLFAAYGALIDAAEFDVWLSLFAATCTYHIVPRENYERGLPPSRARGLDTPDVQNAIRIAEHGQQLARDWEASAPRAREGVNARQARTRKD